MDFRFKYRRKPPAPEEAKREDREQTAIAVNAKQLAMGLSIPATLVTGPVMGWLGGRWLDEHFHTAFWVPLLIVLGLSASLFSIIQQLKALEPK